MPNPFAAIYKAGLKAAGGSCPIEAGFITGLADHECRHGRLPGDRTPPCGCWPEEGTSITTPPAPQPRGCGDEAPAREAA